MSALDAPVRGGRTDLEGSGLEPIDRGSGADAAGVAPGSTLECVLTWGQWPLASGHRAGDVCAVSGAVELTLLARDARPLGVKTVPLTDGHFGIDRGAVAESVARIRVDRVLTDTGGRVHPAAGELIDPGTVGPHVVVVGDNADVHVYSEHYGSFLSEVRIRRVAAASSAGGPAFVQPVPRDPREPRFEIARTPIPRGSIGERGATLVGARWHEWVTVAGGAAAAPRPRIVVLGPAGELVIASGALAEMLRAGRPSAVRVALERRRGPSNAGPPTGIEEPYVWIVTGGDLVEGTRLEFGGIRAGDYRLRLIGLDQGVLPSWEWTAPVRVRAGEQTLVDESLSAMAGLGEERRAILLEFGAPGNAQDLEAVALDLGLPGSAERMIERSFLERDGQGRLVVAPDEDLATLRSVRLEPFDLVVDVRSGECFENGAVRVAVPALERRPVTVLVDGVEARCEGWGARGSLDCAGGAGGPVRSPELAAVPPDGPVLWYAREAIYAVAVEVDGARHSELLRQEDLRDGRVRLSTRAPLAVELERRGLLAGQPVEWWAAVDPLDREGQVRGDALVTEPVPSTGSAGPRSGVATLYRSATLLVPRDARRLRFPGAGEVELPERWWEGGTETLVHTLPDGSE